MDCKICLDAFNDQHKRPRTLPCGHTFCSQCIEGFIRGGGVSCPSCRRVHGGTSINDFPFAYDLEEMISKMNAMLMGKSYEAPKADRNHEKKLVNLNECFYQCTGIHWQLQKYKTNLSQWVIDHEDLNMELRGLMEMNSKVVEQLKKEQETVTLNIKEGAEYHHKLKLAKEELSCGQTVEGSTILSCAELHIDAAEEWAKQCMDVFPNASAIYRSMKVRMAMKNAVGMATKEISDVMNSAVQVTEEGGTVGIRIGDSVEKQVQVKVTPMTNILEKVDGIMGMEPVTVERLLELYPYSMPVVEAGKVFATCNVGGHQRFARISVDNSLICVHHLQDVLPSDNTYILQLSTLLRHVDISSTLVFLDVEWTGSPPCRLYVRLTPDTDRGRQFRFLCTGEKGPSYANTQMLKVINKGKAGECITGGDYDNEGGGGTALISGLTRGGVYKRGEHAGIVWGSRGTQFYITTRSRPNGEVLTVFGNVETGLGTLQLGMETDDNFPLSIVDCGIVVPSSITAGL